MSNPAKKRKKLGSDEQHMFPKAKTGRPGKDLRLIFRIACNSGPWRDLPELMEDGLFSFLQMA